MGILDIFRRRKEEDTKGFTINGSVRAYDGIFSLPTANDADPTKNSAVVAAIKWASRAYVEAPIVTQRFHNGKYETIPEHPASLLLKNPNPFTSGTALWSAVITSLMLDGNAYIVKVRNASGRVVELWYVPHTAMKPATSRSNPELFISHYEYKANGYTYNVPTQDVIHIRDGVNPDNPRLGFSGLASVTREILTDNECSVYSHSILKNFGVTGFTVSPKGDSIIDEDNAAIIKAKLQAQFTGERRGEPLVLSQPVDIQTNGHSPEAMALDKMRSIPEQRIAAVMGIPSQVLGLASGNDQKTYANQAEARESVYESWIIPTYRNVAETLNNHYLAEFGNTSTERIIYDISEIRVLQEDSNKFSDRVLRQWQAGAITRAEVRQALGMQASPEDNIYFFDASLGGLNASSAKAFVMGDIAARMRLQRELMERGGFDASEADE
jgi:HK97 family phage portal protein